MASMTRIALPALMATMAIGAAPASAAPDMYGRHDGDAKVHYAGFGQATNLHRDIARLDRRIDRALARHHISWREASGLRRDVKRIERLFADYKRGGLTRYEARTLEARIAEVDRALRFERRDADRRRG